MKTDALIDLLATGAGPAPRYAVARRFGTAVAFGATGGFALLLFTLGINPAIRDFLALPAFWTKMTFAAVLTLAGFVASLRLARPGVAVGNVKWLAAAAMAALWALALIVLADADPGTRQQLERMPLPNCAVVCTHVRRELLGNARTRPHEPDSRGRRAGCVLRRARRVHLRSALPRTGAAVSGGLVRAGDPDPHRHRVGAREIAAALVAGRAPM
jgi:hypothetical protein